MLSARELNSRLLPDNAQTWVNRHLKFTHGYGLVMSPVNAKDQRRPADLLHQEHPAGVRASASSSRSRAIYFGEEPDSYAIVKAATPEFDYPLGNDNVY